MNFEDLKGKTAEELFHLYHNGLELTDEIYQVFIDSVKLGRAGFENVEYGSSTGDYTHWYQGLLEVRIGPVYLRKLDIDLVPSWHNERVLSTSCDYREGDKVTANCDITYNMIDKNFTKWLGVNDVTQVEKGTTGHLHRPPYRHHENENIILATVKFPAREVYNIPVQYLDFVQERIK